MGVEFAVEDGARGRWGAGRELSLLWKMVLLEDDVLEESGVDLEASA